MRGRLLACLLLAVALSGCYTEPDCVILNEFEWDAPGLYDALQATNADGERVDRPAGAGVPLPDDAGRYGDARVASVRYTDPDGDLRHATAYFGTPPVEARLVVAVPVEDDTPRPLFDTLWDALGFVGGEEAKEAAWQEMLAHDGASGAYVTYTADVAPELDLGGWYRALGNATESTPELGTVHLHADDWRMELTVPWTGRLLDAAPYRIHAMPHGPSGLLVEATLGWTPAHAGEWLREYTALHGLPDGGLDAVERGPVQEVCTLPA